MTGTSYAILTNQGLALLAKVHAGEAVTEITRVTAGDGVLTADTAALTDLISPRYDCAKVVVAKDAANNAIVLTAEVSTALTETGFDLRELGIWANDPDAGEILYAYANLGEYVTRIPATGGGLVKSFEISVYIAVANTQDVVLNVGTADVTPGVMGVLSVPNGGTGADTAPAALANLGALPTAGGSMSGDIIFPSGKGLRNTESLFLTWGNDINGSGYGQRFFRQCFFRRKAGHSAQFTGQPCQRRCRQL